MKKIGEPELSEPDVSVQQRVPGTAAWLAEMARRRTAYAERRARWTDAQLRGSVPEPPTETDRPGARGRTIYDKRQYRFEF